LTGIPVDVIRAIAQTVPEDSSVRIFDVTLVGVNPTTGYKLLLSIGLVLIVLALRQVLLIIGRRTLGGDIADSRRFWARQGIYVITAVILALGLFSIWVTPGTDISTGVGLLSAGLAFALQRVILSFAAYFVILRGDTFGVGDRITMGGVRGDVVRLGFLKTTVMEMGQPPSVAQTDPAVWVNSRQYTGRLVTITNGVIFSEPVYNYSRDFPYIWEEIVLPIAYDEDRATVEQLMLDAARAHAVVDEPAAQAALARMRSRYAMSDASLEPAVYWRLTDNWLELSLRFVVPDRGVRQVKDAISRDIMNALDARGISIASATYDILVRPRPEPRQNSQP
jgi:small-conductance mechanosensitive channel